MTIVVKNLAAAGVVLSLASVSYAAPVSVPNFSFESPATNSTAAVTSWSGILDGGTVFDPYNFSGGGQFFPTATPATEPTAPAPIPNSDGTQLGYVYEGALGSGFSQQLAATLQGSTAYTLTIAVGQYASNFAGPSLGSRIELLAGSTVVASNATVTTVPGTLVNQIAILPNSDAFPALIGQPLTIRMTTTLPNTAAGNENTEWDNVRLDATAVPEPTAMGLLGMGGLVMLRRRRGN